MSRHCLTIFIACAGLAVRVSEPLAAQAEWRGQRILMLRGFGEVHRATRPPSVATVMGINLVSEVARVQGNRLWIRSTSGGDSGWVDSASVIRLSQAQDTLSLRLARDPTNWDLYLRRAEVEHALNQREAATIDYSAAIRFHPTEAFLYLRRARHYNTLHDCAGELADLERAIALAPTSARQGYNLVAELYSLESGVYASCPDSTVRDPQQALAAIRKAVTLDRTRPTLLVILAQAYASAGDLRSAIRAQRQALLRSKAAPAYRADWERQLRQYERALAAREGRHD